MGIELVRLVGDKDFFIVTCDKRINSIGESLRGLQKEHRQQHKVPEYVKYPKTIYLHSKIPLSNLPR